MGRNGYSLEVSELSKGPNLKLSFSWRVHYDEEAYSRHEIADLATVRLKFKQICGLELDKCHAVYIESRKSSETSLIQMNITSEKLNCSKQLNLSNLWSAWVLLGEQQATSLRYNDGMVHVSMVDVNICVCVAENGNAKLNVDPALTDFQLTTTDGSVDVHKACLAARSSVFETMFSGNWKETIEGHMELKGVTGKTLKDLKDFIYLGTLPDDGLCPLILLAKRFLIEDLIAACAKKMAITVLPENLHTLNELACQNNIPELTSSIIELTPDAVVHSAYLMKIKKKMLPQKIPTDTV